MVEVDFQKLMSILLDIGEDLMESGAEVLRVEDTLNRIGYAYGIRRMDVFAITSCINITMELQDGSHITKVRRFRKSAVIDLKKIESINALSRDVCAEPIPTDELEKRVEEITRFKVTRLKMYCGYILAAAAFAVFFGGNAADSLFAACIGGLVCTLQLYLGPLLMNSVISQGVISFIAGLSVAFISKLLPIVHQDQVMIGVIMLLVPGVALTNSLRDILLGDTLSGILRMIEALLLAATLAIGIIVSFGIIARCFS